MKRAINIHLSASMERKGVEILATPETHINMGFRDIRHVEGTFPLRWVHQYLSFLFITVIRIVSF